MTTPKNALGTGLTYPFQPFGPPAQAVLHAHQSERTLASV